MRLRIAVLAAVMLGSVLTGVAGAAGAAANPLVTIRALDRAGNQVAVTASLQAQTSNGNLIDDTLTSAHASRVPPGTYNIAAWVWEPGDTAATLADRQLTVKSNVTVTFDARKGHRVRFTIDDSTVAPTMLEAETFAPGLGLSAFDGTTGTPPAATYVVPGKLPAGWEIFFWTDLIRPHEYLSPVEYQFVRVFSRAIPANLTFASYRARLASDDVTVRALDPGKTGGVGFTPMTPSAFLPAGITGQWATPPFSVEFRFTPGYKWQSCVFYEGGSCEIQQVNNLPVFGAHHYAQTFGSAVYGPSPQVGAAISGRQLQVGSASGGLLVDPHYTADSTGLPASPDQTWLYEGSRLLAHTSGSGYATANISAATHWYTMRVQASRGAGAALAKSVTLYYNFQARANGASPDAFWPRIIPSGLSARNAARHGTRTTVPIWFSDLAGNITVHAVRVWASGNGGKTWKALAVRAGGGRWTVTVTNPAAAGYVSLRVQGTDSSGATAAVTAINAYAVS
jgi:hypothetical protein